MWLLIALPARLQLASRLKTACIASRLADYNNLQQLPNGAYRLDITGVTLPTRSSTLVHLHQATHVFCDEVSRTRVDSFSSTLVKQKEFRPLETFTTALTREVLPTPKNEAIEYFDALEPDLSQCLKLRIVVSLGRKNRASI